jgi:hypothetical protein
MPKRFSRYNFALKAAGGSGAAGSALEKYKNYKTGATRPTYTRNAASNPGNLVEIYLSPFSAAPDTRYATQMSQRAQQKMTDLGTTPALCHHLTANDDTILNPGYSPAKAIVNISGTGEANEISKITGESYKKETGSASYTVPFGGTLANGDNRIFLNVIRALKSAVEAKNSEYSVNFQPERFYL